MRSTNIALLVGTMILLLAGYALSEPTKLRSRSLNEARSNEVNFKTSLRTLRKITNTRDEELEGEERGVSLYGLKKWIPGTHAYKARRAYKKVQQEMARRMKGLKLAKHFEDLRTYGHVRDEQFNEWYVNNVTPKQVRGMMNQAGVTDNTILNLYNARLDDLAGYGKQYLPK